MYFKVWLILLRNLTECKDQKAKEQKEEQDRIKAREAKKMVNIVPHLDKVLPQDLQDYYNGILE